MLDCFGVPNGTSRRNDLLGNAEEKECIVNVNLVYDVPLRSFLSVRLSPLPLSPHLPQTDSSTRWFLWGYSLAFSSTGGKFIGDLQNFGLKGVLEQPSVGSARIPALLYCVFQLMFAAITPILALGAVAERGRLGPLLIFIFIWTTIVYDPIACWTWNPSYVPFTTSFLISSY